MTTPPKPSAPLSAEQLGRLVHNTLATRPDEIGCDTWLAQVGAYVDILLSKGTLPPELEIVAHHVDVCAECAEELDALLEALAPAE